MNIWFLRARGYPWRSGDSSEKLQRIEMMVRKPSRDEELFFKVAEIRLKEQGKEPKRKGNWWGKVPAGQKTICKWSKHHL